MLYDGGEWLTRALATLPWERKLAPTVDVGWSPELVEVLEKEKSLVPTRIQSPDHPACSQVLCFDIEQENINGKNVCLKSPFNI